MAYLGLTPKEAGSSGQDGEVQQNGTSVEDSKVASLWEHMNKGVPNKLHKTFLNKSCSTVDESSQPKCDVRAFACLFFYDEINQLMFVLI